MANVHPAGLGVGRSQWGAPDDHNLSVAQRRYEREALLLLLSIAGWRAVSSALAVGGADHPLRGAVGSCRGRERADRR